MVEQITVEEWLSEIADLERKSGGNEDALTSSELIELTGRTHNWVRNQLRKSIKSGRMEATKKLVKAMDGRNMWVSAYRLVKKRRKR